MKFLGGFPALPLGPEARWVNDLANTMMMMMLMLMLTLMMMMMMMMMMLMMMIGVMGERAPQSFPKREIGVAEIFEY